MKRGFQMVDVFGDGEFSGNPVAVIADSEGLDTEQMLRITRWLNLSETTFLLPPDHPDADYRVRIFTLERELPFAGHPTLGTCHAWLTAGGTPRDPSKIIQECPAGLIEIRRDGERLQFAAPPLIRSGPVESEKLDEILQILKIGPEHVVDAAWADNGPGWVAVLLKSAEAVLELEPARFHERRIEIGVVGPHPKGSEIGWEVRTFFSDQFGALIEDPVTGSFNASAAQWLIGSGRSEPSYVAAQGTRLGRAGRIYVRQSEGEVWIGGRVVSAIGGTIDA